jgi:L-iditol 2-dehydrogenase
MILTTAELSAFRTFRLAPQQIEAPPPGHVQARVEAVGICGSDLHYFSEGAIGDTPCVYPMVLGHEPVGTITALGDGVSGWSVGDRVALEAAHYCYHCEFCMSGRHNVCEKVRFLSSPGDPGFFRSRVNLPLTNILPLPANLSFAEGTLFEPLSIILHSMKFIELTVGETAVVYGAGPIGLTTIAVLRLAGAARIWAVEPLAHRREMALALGADAVIDPTAVDPARQVLADTGGRGADVSVDCAAKGDTINQSLHTTRNAGRVVITGVPSELRPPLEFHTLRRKELYFYSVRRSNHDSVAALELLRTHAARFAPMITHQRGIEQIQPLFELLERYGDGIGKPIVCPAP